MRYLGTREKKSQGKREIEEKKREMEKACRRSGGAGTPGWKRRPSCGADCTTKGAIMRPSSNHHAFWPLFDPTDVPSEPPTPRHPLADHRAPFYLKARDCYPTNPRCSRCNFTSRTNVGAKKIVNERLSADS